MSERMSKGEREDLIRLIKQRERVAKSAAEQRSAAMMAEFERQISALHPFDRNEVWEAAWAAGIEAAKEANERVADEAKRLGIPDEFQPRLSIHWRERGDNAWNSRRTELRRVAKAEIEAVERMAKAQIEGQSVAAQTEIIANGLVSEAARLFLEKLDPVETLMPPLDVKRIQQKLAEQAREKGRGPYLVE